MLAECPEEEDELCVLGCEPGPNGYICTAGTWGTYLHKCVMLSLQWFWASGIMATYHNRLMLLSHTFSLGICQGIPSSRQ